MRQARDERQQRIAQAIANGEEAKHRDIRPHRRTLAHRSRKKGPLGLTITDQRLFQVDHEGETLELPTSYPQPPLQPFFSDGLLTDANCRRGWLGALAYLPSSAADFRWRPEPTGISPPLPHGGRNIGHRHLNRLVVAYHRSSREQYWVPETPDSGRCPAAVQNARRRAAKRTVLRHGHQRMVVASGQGTNQAGWRGGQFTLILAHRGAIPLAVSLQI